MAGRTTPCDCYEYLKAKGSSVPADAPAAVVARGEEGWPDALGWRAAQLPRWRPAEEGALEVKTSTFEGAGRGLFARASLPQWTVLPPYQGKLLTSADLAQRRYTPQMDYVWCPGRRKPLMNASDRELLEGPSAASPTFCVDSRGLEGGNPARFINAARAEAQCRAVNVEICELGQVAYFRTTQTVAAGTELVTEYGDYYWEGFQGC